MKNSTRFEDTSVWNDSVNLAVRIYKLTKLYPIDTLGNEIEIIESIQRQINAIRLSLK